MLSKVVGSKRALKAKRRRRGSTYRISLGLTKRQWPAFPIFEDAILPLKKNASHPQLAATASIPRGCCTDICLGKGSLIKNATLPVNIGPLELLPALKLPVQERIAEVRGLRHFRRASCSTWPLSQWPGEIISLLPGDISHTG